MSTIQNWFGPEGLFVGAVVMLGTLLGLVVVIYAAVLRFDPDARGDSDGGAPR